MDGPFIGHRGSRGPEVTWRAYDTAVSHFIASSDEAGLQLHVRTHCDDPTRRPVLFVHGATYASRLYDIPHRDMSWLMATAKAGFAAYALDIRGYGLSRSNAMEAAREPYARATAAIRDIDDVVRWLCDRHRVAAVNLVGGSWGSITTALYATTIGESRVARLVLYAPIFAERNQGWLDLLADPDNPSRLNPALKAFRWIDEAGTRTRWDDEIPAGKGDAWRDEGAFQALVQSSIADDPLAASRPTPAFRAPNGTFVDLWEAFNGRPLYDPRRLLCPLLLIRGSADTSSTRCDALTMFDLTGSERRSYIEIAEGTHFISAEWRHIDVFAACNTFLGQ